MCEYNVIFDLTTHLATLTGDSVVFGWETDGTTIPSSRLLELVYPEDVPEMLDAIERCAELVSGQRIEFCLRFKHEDGGVYQSRIVCEPGEIVRGKVVTVLAKVHWLDAPNPIR